MREIKFRVYDKNGGYYIAILDNDCFGIKQVARIILELEVLKHEYIIEQYTGLKDKNGKEIYEGDIIDCNYGFGQYVVVYRRYDASFILEDDSREEIIKLVLAGKTFYEVIGNIHENPELLEGKNELMHNESD